MNKDKTENIVKNGEYIKENYVWEDLLAVVTKLRAPDGCPWDRAQTHESMKSCLVEECYEVIEAIDNNDLINMREELGDVLLQVLLHSEIAKEEEEFTLDEVIDELAKKLVRRHPHVFGEGESTKDVNEGLSRWDSVKVREKEERKAELIKLIEDGKASPELLKKQENSNSLQNIPKAFPALIRAQKVHKKAGKELGIESSAEKALENIRNIMNEIEIEINKNSQTINVAGLIGNGLLEMVKLSDEMGENAENSLTNAIEEYINKNVR